MSNSRNRHTRWILAGTLALALPLTAAAHRHGDERCGHDRPGRHAAPEHDVGTDAHRDGRPPRMLAGIDLSDAQREQVNRIRSEERDAMRKLAEAQRSAHDELHDLANAANYSEAQARKLSEVAGKAQADMAMLRVRSSRQIHELLTPEQRKAVEERRAEWRKRIETQRDDTAKGR